MKKFLQTRRSTKIKDMAAPGPDADQLHDILTIAARIPDHKKLVPFRFVVFQGARRGELSARLRDIFLKDHPEATPQQLEFEAERLTRAPMVIAVISSVQDNKDVPHWEQVLTAGAVCYNLCLAANAHGFGTNWVSEWYSYHPDVNALLKLQDRESIAGFIYIGTAVTENPDRDRPNIEAITKFY